MKQTLEWKQAKLAELQYETVCIKFSSETILDFSFIEGKLTGCGSIWYVDLNDKQTGLCLASISFLEEDILSIDYNDSWFLWNISLKKRKTHK